ncbi:MAG TPA: hypothetical protein PLB31_08975 [Fimbriimonadaceae bacterium]|nr:hypothetical protein [Fimbriimonadaceae bacterium]HRI74585.1 hypothetical protein [Fimbriimonadaceae bacterium]
MYKTPLVIVSLAGVALLAFFGLHCARLNANNPLYQNCKANVKSGMTLEAVRQLCGKPLINVKDYQFEKHSYQESMASDEALYVDFTDGVVVRVRIKRI